MTPDKADPEEKAKRTDVGYKRPPAEHQFKKGQKPPPRRKKIPEESFSPTEKLWCVLHEKQRIHIEGKAVWLSNAELIIRRAMHLAEAGNPTMQRAIIKILFSLDEGKPKLNGRARLERNGVFAGWMPDWGDDEWNK